MRKAMLGLLMILIVFALIVGCQSNVKQDLVKQEVQNTLVVPESKVVEKSGEVKQVVVKDSKFNPATIEINAGDNVEWINNDVLDDSESEKKDPQGYKHTVTFDDNSYNEQLPVGATVSRLFSEKGTYTYHCALHPEMQGQVIVN